jgi:hypothetical protein
MAITITVPPPGQVIGRFEDLNAYVRATAPPLKRAVLSAQFPGAGRTEEIHDGDNFLPPYSGSLRQPYTDGSGTGFQYLIRRAAGWPDGPVIHVVAYDTAGGEAIV